MGNRALVVFTDGGRDVSPGIYLHWHGSAVPELLAQLRERMQNRGGDVSYAAARFCGIAHERIPGNLSLGLQSIGHTRTPAEYCPGDAGVFLVDVTRWRVLRVTCSDNRGECDAPPAWTIGAQDDPARKGAPTT